MKKVTGLEEDGKSKGAATDFKNSHPYICDGDDSGRTTRNVKVQALQNEKVKTMVQMQYGGNQVEVVGFQKIKQTNYRSMARGTANPVQAGLVPT